MRPVLFALGLSAVAFAAAQTLKLSASAPFQPSPAIQKIVDDAEKLPDTDRIAALEKALRSAQTARDAPGEGLVLFFLGTSRDGLGDHRKALDDYNRALRILQKLGNRHGECSVLNNMGWAHAGLGEYDRAVTYYARALPLAREAGHPGDEASVLKNIAAAYERLGQHDKASEYLKQVRVTPAPAPDATTKPCPEVTKIIDDAEKLDRKDQFAAYEKGFPIARAKHDLRGEASLDVSCAAWALNTSRPELALDYANRALPIVREFGDRESEATVHMILGGVNANLGQLEEGIAEFQHALAIYKELGEVESQTYPLLMLQMLYSAEGEIDKARGVFEQALPLYRKTGNRADEAKSLLALVMGYVTLDQADKGLAIANRALKIAHEIRDPNAEATVLTMIGALHVSKHRIGKARALFEQALVLDRESGELSLQATSLDDLGEIYAALGDKKKAMSSLGEALSIERRLAARGDEAQTLGFIAKAYRGFHEPSLAIAFGKRAVNATQSLRADMKGLDKDIQAAFKETVAERYRDLADVLAEQNRLPEAERVLDLLKDQEFFEFIRRRAGDSAETVDLTPREADWLAQYDLLGDKLAADAAEEETLSNVKPRSSEQEGKLHALREEVDSAAKAFNEFLARAESAFSAKGVTEERLEDIRAGQTLQSTLQRLPNRPAALYTLVTADGVRVFVDIPGLVRPRQSKKTKLSAADLNKKILAFRETLVNPKLDPRPLGAELYDVLIRPIESDLQGAGVQTLMWSLDGALRYIPLGALYDRESKQYLVEKYPSCLFTPHTVNRLLEPPRTWSGAEFGVSKGGTVGESSFEPLPGVGEELAGVHDALGGPVPLMDDAFTMDAFRDALDGQPPVVHIATHFRFRPGDDAGSVLLLGKGGTLSVAELAAKPGTLFAGVDLLVLSACETAMGGNADGKEFDGFALLAQEKGAGAVLATLWSVADQSTALLMDEFYRLRKGHPEWTKIEALRQAQLEMLRGRLGGGNASTTRSSLGRDAPGKSDAPPWPSGQPRYAHPYYWAPFVLTGNWK